MSAKLTEIEMSDGMKMAFEYDDITSKHFQAVGFPKPAGRKERMEKMKESIESTLKMFEESIVSYMDNELIKKDCPKSISLEFGLQFGGEMGVPFVTKGSANANFKVSVTWESKKMSE
jgi:hypothetical protein